MFCLMDVSASMTEPLKDLAKRFFMLLHVFLTRYYREVHIVFIRHTSTAAGGRRGDVLPRHRDRRHRHLHGARGDAEGRAASAIRPPTGTSTRRRPPTATTSTTTCRAACELLDEEMLPVCQYFAYIEIDARRALQRLRRRRRCGTATTEVAPAAQELRHARAWRRRRTSIPVFHELFSASDAAA